jgi:hypothetical protein
MNLRHAAALALVGWYLMVPPFTAQRAGPVDVDDQAPLSKWTIAGSFDTAEQCRDYDRFFRKQVENEFSKDAPSSFAAELDGREYRDALHSACIARRSAPGEVED